MANFSCDLIKNINIVIWPDQCLEIIEVVTPKQVPPLKHVYGPEKKCKNII